jgi:hypothetical protein
MDNSAANGIKEYEFSRNVDFIDTPLIEVKKELMKKKIQLNSTYNNKMLSTENLYKYVVELEDYLENETIARKKIESDFKDSMRICNLLISSSIFVFVVFGVFAILASNLLLGIIAIINGLVFGIMIYYKNTIQKNIETKNNKRKEMT